MEIEFGQTFVYLKTLRRLFFLFATVAAHLNRFSAHVNWPDAKPTPSWINGL